MRRLCAGSIGILWPIVGARQVLEIFQFFLQFLWESGTTTLLLLVDKYDTKGSSEKHLKGVCLFTPKFWTPSEKISFFSVHKKPVFLAQYFFKRRRYFQTICFCFDPLWIVYLMTLLKFDSFGIWLFFEICLLQIDSLDFAR